MLYVVPNPTKFFSAFGTVALVLSLLWPLTLDTGSAEKAWLIAIHVVVGVMVISLLNGIVGLVTRLHEPAALPR